MLVHFVKKARGGQEPVPRVKQNHTCYFYFYLAIKKRSMASMLFSLSQMIVSYHK
jgi:hypothetical protein